jgi:CRISPR-associated protein Cmr6
MPNGNYGLWYNKFIPIKDFSSFKVSDEKGNENNAVSYYYDKYNRIQKGAIHGLLDKKHMDQAEFCAALSSGYETVVFKAKLKTPLITGIGETHPHEVSMVFDHNMGIPYIPASGVKGIVRFAHTLRLIDKIPDGKLLDTDKDGKPCPLHFNDDEDWTYVPQLFGAQDQRGAVIFLDAYPEEVPDLHVDIMNPHYGDYYGADTSRTPPADYLNPVPIKFLTVAKDTAFIFRALVGKNQVDLVKKVKNAFEKALTAEGVGAKTAVGYGRFDILTDSESVSGFLETKQQQPVAVVQDIKTPLEKLLDALNLLNSSETGRISGEIINKMDIMLESDHEKADVARAIKEKLSAKAFKKLDKKKYGYLSKLTEKGEK